jgi:hypothetical protein
MGALAKLGAAIKANILNLQGGLCLDLDYPLLQDLLGLFLLSVELHPVESGGQIDEMGSVAKSSMAWVVDDDVDADHLQGVGNLPHGRFGNGILSFGGITGLTVMTVDLFGCKSDTGLTANSQNSLLVGVAQSLVHHVEGN